MKDKKELLEQTIKEDLEKEAQEILKALETSDADKLSDEKQLELKKCHRLPLASWRCLKSTGLI